MSKAEILEPNSVDILLLKGTVYLATGDLDASESLFLQAIALEDDAPEAYYQLSELYQLKGDYETAIIYLKISGTEYGKR